MKPAISCVGKYCRLLAVFRASGVTKAEEQPMEKADEYSVFFFHEKTSQNPAL